jgi:hypothetical protein
MLNKARVIGIWISGICAGLALGGGIGQMARSSSDAPFSMGLGLMFAFICLRLWLGEKRG